MLMAPSMSLSIVAILALLLSGAIWGSIVVRSRVMRRRLQRLMAAAGQDFLSDPPDRAATRYAPRGRSQPLPDRPRMWEVYLAKDGGALKVRPRFSWLR